MTSIDAGLQRLSERQRTLEIRRRVQIGRYRQIHEANAVQLSPAIKMVIGPWHVDEHGNRSRLVFAQGGA